MPEKGTSRIKDTFRPVTSPLGPSFFIICLNASVTPEYSENPMTSNRVLTMISGFDMTDWNVREAELARKEIYGSRKRPVRRSISSQ